MLNVVVTDVGTGITLDGDARDLGFKRTFYQEPLGSQRVIIKFIFLVYLHVP